MATNEYEPSYKGGQLIRAQPKTGEDDRRHDERAEVSTVALVLVRHNPGVEMTIESLSVGGARLSGAVTLGKGERIQILFDIESSPIEVVAEVVWVDHQDILIDRVAVRFVSLTSHDREAIRRLVQRVLDLDPIVDESAELAGLTA